MSGQAPAPASAVRPAPAPVYRLRLRLRLQPSGSRWPRPLAQRGVGGADEAAVGVHFKEQDARGRLPPWEL